MASRVNTKFVVILIVAVIAMLGMLFAAYTVVYKTAEDVAKKGDQAIAAGDFEQARVLYGMAVSKDPTIVANLEKWIELIEMWTPDTETAYYDAFRSDYMGAIRQAAIVQRTNVEAYHRELGLHFDLLARQYTRGQADNVIARTTEVLGNFDGLPGVDPAWPELRRYRGMAWQRIGDQNGVIDQAQYELIREDLDTALESDPGDELARASRMRWMIYESLQGVEGNDISGVTKAREEAIAFGEAHLQQFPNSPLVQVALLSIEVELAGADAYGTESESDAQRTQAVLDSWIGMQGKLDSLHNTLMATDASKLSLDILNRFVAIEIRVDPESNLTRAALLMEKLREGDSQSLNVLVATAGLYAIRGETEKAAEAYSLIIGLPVPPVSADGVLLFTSQREALLTITSLKLDKHAQLSRVSETTEAELEALLNEAKIARDDYASRVSEDNTNLMFINGRIAFVEKEYEESLRLLKLYNSQTENLVADGLWFEALSARELNQLGTAREALNNLVALKKHDTRALILLANIETQLQDTTMAKYHYEQALATDPSNAVAADGLARLRALENPDLIEDPVIALVVTARQLRTGSDGNPGDLTAAIALLREHIEDEDINYAAAATRELVSFLMDMDDLAGSRALLDKAIATNPDSQELALMRTAMQNDDEVEILVAMINQSDAEPVEKLISIAGTAFSRERFELLDSTINELLELSPEDPRVIDLAFVRALANDDLARAEEMVQRSISTNADRVNGLSYQARMASFKDDHARAIQLLEQATAGGVADASVFRMLGVSQRETGLGDASVASFERALSIRPDDQATIQEYLNTLVMLRRYTTAIDVARRFQRYAAANPQFMSLWLTLEAIYGGAEGQEFAIRHREKFLELDPNDAVNNFALASLYVQTERWAESRRLIDDLKSGDDSLSIVQLEALWYANQGRVGNLNGLAAARQVYLDYIERHPESEDAEPYIALARFMIDRGRPDLAIQAATEAVDHQDPATLDGTKLLGDLFMMLNQFTNAGDSFRTVVEGGADEDNQYRLRLIDMLIRTRQFEEARTQFDLLDSANSMTKIAMLQNAEIEEGLGNEASASDLLDQAVAAFSDDPLVYIKRAEFLSGSEETLTDMLADVDAALQIDANDWRAYRVRAAGYFAVDQRAEALRDLQRAVRLNPSLDQALFGIINELMIDGRNSEAYDFAVEIIESRRHDATLINSLGQLFSSRDDWDRASLFYKLVWDVQRSPNSGAILIDAIVRTRNPDTNLANAVINDLTEIAGDINSSPGLLAAQALVLQARGRDELALQQLTKAFDLSVNSDAQLMQWSGNISRYFESLSMQDQISYLETIKRRNLNQEVLNWLDLFIAQRLVSVGSQLDAAFTIYDRLIDASEQPEIQRITFQSYGTTMYAREDYVRAAELWTKGVELFPEDWEMSNNLAYVLSAEMGEHERALGLAQNAIAANPDRSEPYDTIGNIYTALGEYDKAYEMLNEGMKYALSVRARVTLVIAQINLDLAKGEKSEAESKLLDIRSLMRAMPTRDLGLEQQVDDVEVKIDSAG